MGLNLVIGCHECRERIWFFRGELDGMESFYRAHWNHYRSIQLSNDQADEAWIWDDSYEDVAENFSTRIST